MGDEGPKGLSGDDDVIGPMKIQLKDLRKSIADELSNRDNIAAQLRVQSQEAQALLASIEGKNLPIKRPNWYKQLKSWAVKRRAALGKSSRDLLKA